MRAVTLRRLAEALLLTTVLAAVALLAPTMTPLAFALAMWGRVGYRLVT